MDGPPCPRAPPGIAPQLIYVWRRWPGKDHAHGPVLRQLAHGGQETRSLPRLHAPGSFQAAQLSPSSEGGRGAGGDRLPGTRPGQPRDHARAWWFGHQRRRPSCRFGCRALRHLHRRGRGVYVGSPNRLQGAQVGAHYLRGNAGNGIDRHQDPADPGGLDFGPNTLLSFLAIKLQVFQPQVPPHMGFHPFPRCRRTDHCQPGNQSSVQPVLCEDRHAGGASQGYITRRHGGGIPPAPEHHQPGTCPAAAFSGTWIVCLPVCIPKGTGALFSSLKLIERFLG